MSTLYLLIVLCHSLHQTSDNLRVIPLYSFFQGSSVELHGEDTIPVLQVYMHTHVHGMLQPAYRGWCELWNLLCQLILQGVTCLTSNIVLRTL